MDAAAAAGAGAVAASTRNPTAALPRWNVPVARWSTHRPGRRPSKSCRKPANRRAACPQLSGPAASSVSEYCPAGTRNLPMRSSFSTWNVPGQRSPVAGCWPPPPPLGASTGAIEKPAPDAPVNVAVAASSRHGAGSRPSQSSRNWRSRSAACAHESRAGSSTVIRYGPAGTAKVPIASSWRTWNVDGHADGEGACAGAGAAAASPSTATTASTEPVRVSVLMPSPRACRRGRRRPRASSRPARRARAGSR